MNGPETVVVDDSARRQRGDTAMREGRAICFKITRKWFIGGVVYILAATASRETHGNGDSKEIHCSASMTGHVGQIFQSNLAVRF